MDKKNTGYPHIDKPWMKYYEGVNISEKEPNTNMTDYLKMKNEARGNLFAEEYYGKKITYSEFFEKIDLASRILTQLGVKKGDVIMNLVPNIPEEEELFYGATQIGAISDYIDPRPDGIDLQANANKVLEIIKYEQPKYLVAVDICYLAMLKPIENELKELGINDIIILNSGDSMNLKGKISYLTDVVNYNVLNNKRNVNESIKQLKNYEAVLQKLKTMNKMNKDLDEAIKSSLLNIHKYSDLKKECKNSPFVIIKDENLINYIGHTSGTSGARPKPIALTNKNGISSLVQCEMAKVAPNMGERALHILPGFAPFGRYNNDSLNFAVGACNIHIPEFVISEFGYLLKRHKPNAIMTTPAWLSTLPDYDELQNEDLSYLTKIIYGGDSMTPEDEEKLNEWLYKHGSNATVEKGHGMSEFCGCGSYARADYNKYGSIGIPIPKTIYTIVDPNIEDRLVPLKFEEGQEKLTGELVVSSDHVTNGMLRDDVIVPHFEMDGKSYIRTRDIADMDSDGVFYIQGRKDRSFARFDGYKIKPFEIEKTIKENEHVKYAVLVDYFEEKRRGIMPICHIVLNEENLSDDEKVKIVNDIVYNQIIGNPTMSSRQIPSKFKIREAMPLTKNSKVNFNALRAEELDGTEINVDVNETNLAVDSINIYMNKNDNKKFVKKI
ncbi:MAG: AMP-binding protein [Bacilli bacterium]